MEGELFAQLNCISQDSRKWGIKAVNLSRILNAGFFVPRGIVLCSSLFQEYIGYSDTMEIEHYLERISDFLSKIIRKSRLHRDNLIFRSSADIEGSSSWSFCGVFDSVIFEPNQRLTDPLTAVWQSVFSPAARRYCSNVGITPSNINMAVIVQEIYHGQFYGVIQSRDIVNSLDRVIIEYSEKKVDAVVSGTNDSSLLILSQSGVSMVEDCPMPLTHTQKELLLRTAFVLEEVFSSPVEIEFSINNDEIAVLQARTLS